MWRRNGDSGRRNPAEKKQNEKNAFKTWPLVAFEGPSPTILDWKLLGTFCTTANREICYENRKPKFIKREYIPDTESITVHMDMKANPETVMLYDIDRRKTLLMLLCWILDNRHIITESENPQRLRANVVCGQHILTILAMTPFMGHIPWTICATKYQGTVYLSEYKRDERSALRNIRGHKFHQYLTKGNANEIFDPNEEFRTVVSSSIGKHSLLYSAQVTGADPDLFTNDFCNLDSFINAKTCVMKNTSSYHWLLSEKLLGIWATNTFSKIPRALVGFAKGAVVESINRYDTEEIPNIVQDKWNPNVVFNFVEKFLDFVQATVEDNPDVIYAFERKVRGPVMWRVVPKTGDYVVLDDWFVSRMKDTNGLQAIQKV
ncbi:decapping and exoribonuclease protein-like [Oratosquilla oratoria]|uniref:decapping and exoribonuclease protein-like n=1 Tax=Oratosquilla oratoria TaxID=337810 RepID=UPI003F77734B